MFRKKPKTIGDLLNQVLRHGGLEIPLCQRRLLGAWEDVAGEVAAKYTESKYIKNQTLFVKIGNPALRADLAMMKARLIKELNSRVGSFVISDIRIC